MLRGDLQGFGEVVDGECDTIQSVKKAIVASRSRTAIPTFSSVIGMIAHYPSCSGSRRTRMRNRARLGGAAAWWRGPDSCLQGRGDGASAARPIGLRTRPIG